MEALGRSRALPVVGKKSLLLGVLLVFVVIIETVHASLPPVHQAELHSESLPPHHSPVLPTGSEGKKGKTKTKRKLYGRFLHITGQSI